MNGEDRGVRLTEPMSVIAMFQQLAIRARPVGNYLYAEARVADHTAWMGARWSV